MNGFDSLSDGHIQAITAIRSIWKDEPIIIIGGMALACQARLPYRSTQDLDLAIAIAGSRVGAELKLLPGWTQDPEVLHRWHAPGDTRVDVIPMPPEALAAGRLQWDNGGTMSLKGFGHLLTEAIPFATRSDLRLALAPVKLVVFLKLVAYLERPADRIRDLGDIAYLLDEHNDDPRILAPHVIRTQLSEDLLGAFLMGLDLGQLLEPDEVQLALDFVDRVLMHRDGGFTEQQLTRNGPPSWREDPDRVRHVMRAFERGLLASP